MGRGEGGRGGNGWLPGGGGRPGWLSGALLGMALAMAWNGAGAAAAQSLEERSDRVEGVAELAAACDGGRSALRATCRELSLAVMSVQRAAGLLAALGSDVPGTSSTHGRRLGLAPRVGVSLSASALRFSLPDVSGRTAGALAESDAATLAGLRATAVAGLLDGFGFGPGVGGILSLDLIGSYAIARFPTDKGLSSSGSAVGLGARVGVLRESFTLPGISVAATRSWHTEIELGDDRTPGAASTSLTVSSLRATAGKNWFVIGVMGGVGWDRYEGDARLRAGSGGDHSGRVASERILYFASGWFNFLITRFSVEAGLAEGNRDPFQSRAGAFDPAERSWFASAALRVTL